MIEFNTAAWDVWTNTDFLLNNVLFVISHNQFDDFLSFDLP